MQPHSLNFSLVGLQVKKMKKKV